MLVPFIKRTFPRARLVPLILRGTPDYGEFFRLGENLRQASPEKTVLLVSSDFAHGVDAATAARLDRKSLVNLRPLRLADLNRIQADARPGLAVLAGFLGPGPRNFVLKGHKTSADFGSRDPGNLTSYITAYYQEPREAKFSLLFLGDLMFDRGIRKVAAAKGNDFIFQGVRALLAGHRLVIANLEGPITSRPSVSLGRPPQEKNHYLFTFPPGLAPTLKRHHVNLVHLGNNHLLDFGPEGLAQTRKHLESSGVGWFGDPLDETHRWIIKPVNGVKLALVSYNQFTPQAVDKTLSDLKQVRPQADLVILYAHWDAEYRGQPGDRTRSLAHLFIDQGADLVIGSHSHTVQPPETYQGKMIYYSLGNFIFDQGGREETRRGLALEVRVHPRNLALDFKEIPLLLEKNGQTTLRCQ